jgi:hypothetical protein
MRTLPHSNADCHQLTGRKKFTNAYEGSRSPMQARFIEINQIFPTSKNVGYFSKRIVKAKIGSQVGLVSTPLCCK